MLQPRAHIHTRSCSNVLWSHHEGRVKEDLSTGTDEYEKKERKKQIKGSRTKKKQGINATGLKWSVREKKAKCTNLTNVKEHNTIYE